MNGYPRQWQTRREAGTQSYGLLTARGGADKAARLPKGWTGPEKYAWFPGLQKWGPGYIFALILIPFSIIQS